LPHRVLIGCTAGGVIGGGREIEQRPGLSLTAASLPGVAITPLAIEGSYLPDLDAGPRAWHDTLGVATEPTPHFVLLAEPFSFPSETLLAGLDFAYPRSVKIGGLASSATRPGGNALYVTTDAIAGAGPGGGPRASGGSALAHDTETGGAVATPLAEPAPTPRPATMRRTGLVGVALAGNIVVDTVVAQGCRPIGEPLRITRCDRNVLLEIEGKPALQKVRDLILSLSEEDQQLASRALFLGVVNNELLPEPGAGDFLIRNLVGIDPEHGALAVGDTLRNGQIVQFHLRDARTAALDLRLVLDRFASGAAARDARGALLFSCLGRGIHLYGRADHDTDAFRDRVGDIPLGGFFCNGEIGPVGDATYLHGFTSSFGIFRPART
jgi:small ligand-binding sensory domain FIST